MSSTSQPLPPPPPDRRPILSEHRATVLAAVWATVGVVIGALAAGTADVVTGYMDSQTQQALEQFKLEREVILRAIQSDEDEKRKQLLRFFACVGLTPTFKDSIPAYKDYIPQLMQPQMTQTIDAVHQRANQVREEAARLLGLGREEEAEAMVNERIKELEEEAEAAGVNQRIKELEAERC